MHPDRVKDRLVELSDEIRLADRGLELGNLERNWRAFAALCGEPIDGADGPDADLAIVEFGVGPDDDLRSFTFQRQFERGEDLVALELQLTYEADELPELEPRQLIVAAGRAEELRAVEAWPAFTACRPLMPVRGLLEPSQLD